jgi:hypothetical protein
LYVNFSTRLLICSRVGTRLTYYLSSMICYCLSVVSTWIFSCCHDWIAAICVRIILSPACVSWFPGPECQVDHWLILLKDGFYICVMICILS